MREYTLIAYRIYEPSDVSELETWVQKIGVLLNMRSTGSFQLGLLLESGGRIAFQSLVAASDGVPVRMSVQVDVADSRILSLLLDEVGINITYAVEIAAQLILEATKGNLDVVRLAPLGRSDWGIFGVTTPTYFGTLVGQYVFHSVTEPGTVNQSGLMRLRAKDMCQRLAWQNAAIALVDKQRAINNFLDAWNRKLSGASL